MKTFDTQKAMKIISHSDGGFSYDTLARALISKDKNEDSTELLKECRKFCLHLEEKGILRRCHNCLHPQDEYYVFVTH
ncbi:hypothetical protein ENKO_37730 [Enterobacter kobei]|uniref:Uncharacterized protein n=1 Tax=Enterobacter kobei TaxID=208224 RepID=A0AA86MEW7_9ENTR|nr:hypothetical protein ENKO_37730 [Enterobacter kobei]SIR22071.1 hypothetical protein SAMN05444841_103257 [Enterobacter kobei]